MPYLLVVDDPVVRVGTKGSSMDITLRDDMTAVFNNLLRHGKNKVILERVDLTRDRCIVTERDPMNDACLVHVALEHDGQFWYEANTYNEEVYHERRREKVRRAYRPFEDAMGISVVAWGMGPNKEPHALLHMVAGASFRICRDTETFERPPVLVVAWPGTKLKVIMPEKYKKALTATASAA